MMTLFKVKWVYIISIAFLLIGCNKEGAGCFNKAGDIKTVTMEVSSFTAIDVTTNIDVNLVNDGSDRVEVTTGEQLIEGISLKVEEGVLKISNLNTCFWSIGYVHPVVTIRNSNLQKVVQHGYGQVYSKDTLYVDELYLQIEDASGGFDLLLNASKISLVSNSIGSVVLKGKSNILHANHSWGDGILYASSLLVYDCRISQSGSNRMEINVSNSLTGSINNLGNVYLMGQKPAIQDVALTSEGKIIENF